MNTDHTNAEPSRVSSKCLTHLVQSIYQASHHRSIRKLQCHYEAGVLIISGQVPNYYLKQLAQSLVRHVNGVERIVNQVHVSKPRKSILDG